MQIKTRLLSCATVCQLLKSCLCAVCCLARKNQQHASITRTVRCGYYVTCIQRARMTPISRWLSKLPAIVTSCLVCVCWCVACVYAELHPSALYLACPAGKYTQGAAGRTFCDGLHSVVRLQLLYVSDRVSFQFCA